MVSEGTAHGRLHYTWCPNGTAATDLTDTTASSTPAPSRTDRYRVRHLQDFSAHLRGKNSFAVVDLEKAFTQIRVHPDDIPKTAITTPFGLYEFPYMTFELQNAGQTFQRFIDAASFRVSISVSRIATTYSWQAVRHQSTSTIWTYYSSACLNTASLSTPLRVFSAPKPWFFSARSPPTASAPCQSELPTSRIFQGQPLHVDSAVSRGCSISCVASTRTPPNTRSLLTTSSPVFAAHDLFRGRPRWSKLSTVVQHHFAI